MRVLGLSGSLRAESYNTRLLQGAGSLLPNDVAFSVYDRLRELPHYDADSDDPAPVAAPVQALRDAVAEADALLIATPEYNGSIPGFLKNAVDWASRPRTAASLQDKPVLVIGASTGLFGAVWAQAELRKVLGVAGARVVGDEELPVPAVHDALDAHDLPVDLDVRARLQDLVDLLVREAVPVPA